MPGHAPVEGGEGLDKVEFEELPWGKGEVPVVTAVEEHIQDYCQYSAALNQSDDSPYSGMEVYTYPTLTASEMINILSVLMEALKYKNAPRVAQIKALVGLRIHATAANPSDSFKLVSGPLRTTRLAVFSTLLGHGQ